MDTICVKQIIKEKLHFCFENCLRSQKQFIRTVEGHIQFLKQNTFLTYFWNIGTDNWNVCT